MNPTNTFDIIVIGAGPAGSMAAQYAAKGGTRVALIERKKKVGIPVRCGEAIGLKGARSIGFNVDPSWILSEIKKVCMVAPNGTSIEYTGMAESYVVDRELMDQGLVNRAIKSGVQYFPHCPVISVKPHENSWYECKGTQGIFKARCIIIADGVESSLAKDLGWNTTLKLEDVDCCAFGRIKCSINPDTCYFILGSRITPAGYLWIFPRGNGYANIGVGVLGSHSTPGKAKELLFRYVDEHYPDSTLTHIHCAAAPAGKYLTPLVKDGVMIVGDAARQIISLTGGGINYSLFAGKTAGRIAAETFLQHMGNTNYLKKYETIWRKGLGKQQLRSYALKTVLMESVDDTFLNRIANSFAGKKPNSLSILKIFLRTFAWKPKAFIKAFLLFR
ncbi:MAG: NAD(P)/FAD-dependent oxidoreductase [Chitinispirillia bacterium]|jgi:digeranylgeranylglycerophospholipid reductase